MRKILIASLLTIGFSFAQDKINDINQEDINRILKFNIIQETTEGKEEYIYSSPLKKIETEEKKKVKLKIVPKKENKPKEKKKEDKLNKLLEFSPTDAFLFEKVVSRKFNEPSNAKNIDLYKSKNNENANENQENKESNINKTVLYTEGYCIVDREVIVNRLDMYSTFPCYFDKLGTATVFGRLVPNPSALALLFKPIEVRTSEGIAFKVTGGFVLDGTKTTNNIADYVNNRALEKIFYKSLAQGASTTTKAYEDYFKNKNKKTTYIPNGNGNAIVVENKYDSNYPIKTGFMALVDSLISNTMQYLTREIDNMPVLFKIEAGKKIYMELELSPKEAIYREPLTKSKVEEEKAKVKKKENENINPNNKEIKIKIGE